MNLSFKSYWNLLSDHIRPQKGRFILLAVLMFGSIGLRIFAPQIMRKFIDSALAGEALANPHLDCRRFHRHRLDPTGCRRERDLSRRKRRMDSHQRPARRTGGTRPASRI